MKKQFLFLVLCISFMGCFSQQRQYDAFKGTATGTDTYTVTIAAITDASPYDGQTIKVLFSNSNTGAATLRVLGASGIIYTARAITLNGSALTAGNIVTNQYITFIYYLPGTSWQMQKTSIIPTLTNTYVGFGASGVLSGSSNFTFSNSATQILALTNTVTTGRAIVSLSNGTAAGGMVMYGSSFASNILGTNISGANALAIQSGNSDGLLALGGLPISLSTGLNSTDRHYRFDNTGLRISTQAAANTTATATLDVIGLVGSAQPALKITGSKGGSGFGPAITDGNSVIVLSGDGGDGGAALGNDGGTGGAITITTGNGGNSGGSNLNGNSGAISLQTGTPGTGATGGVRGFIKLQPSGGYVGIGNGTPSAKLEVSSADTYPSLPTSSVVPTFRTSTESIGYCGIDFGQKYNNYSWMQGWNWSGLVGIYDPTPILINPKGGFVGIGTNTVVPTASLEVDGSSGTTLKIVDGSQGANKVLTSDASGFGTWKYPTQVYTAHSFTATETYTVAANTPMVINTNTTSVANPGLNLATLTASATDGQIFCFSTGSTPSSGNFTIVGAKLYAADGTYNDATSVPFDIPSLGGGVASQNVTIIYSTQITPHGWMCKP
jgi:hypothetical protein